MMANGGVQHRNKFIIMLHNTLAFTMAIMATSPLTTAFAPARSLALGSSSSSLLTGLPSTSSSFRPNNKNIRSNSGPIIIVPHSKLFSRITTYIDEDEEEKMATFDPFGCSNSWEESTTSYVTTSSGTSHHRNNHNKKRNNNPTIPMGTALATLTAFLPIEPSSAKSIPLSTGDFNPDSFKPVCAASDSFYRFLQGSTRAIVGDENFSEYGPLIAGGLLRIRLELCVVESFFNEAVGPFIKENGLNWILPWHETVETFIAGSIFALATTFILVGSTKIIQIIAFYGDLVLGGPCRLLGGFFFDRARGEPVTLDISILWWKKRLIGPPVDFKEEELKKKMIAAGVESGGTGKKPSYLDFDNVKPADIPLLVVSGGVKLAGETLKIFREFIEAIDLFVGRYLVLLASGYIIIKFVHFKIFPDFP